MTATDGAVVVVEALTKRFPGSDARPVLDAVDLRLAAGESLAIVGPSGSGKSTLLNVIGSLEPATEGSVRTCGVDVTRSSSKELARLRNEELGFVFQHHLLLPQCTALENVLLPTLAERSGGDRAALETRARALLERVGLGARIDARPATLSGGERQRVAVVRALINQPRLLLADEPTGSLDQASAAALGDLLVELNQESGLAVLVVTHSAELAERMQSVRELRDGALSEGVPRTV